MIGIENECILFVFIAGTTVEFTLKELGGAPSTRKFLRCNKKFSNGKSLRVLRRILNCDEVFPIKNFSNKTCQIDPDKNQEIEIIKLIDQNYNLNLDVWMNNRSVLNFIDNVSENFEIIKFLVNEFNVSINRGIIKTPLHLCIDEENMEILEFLAGKGADLDYSIISRRNDYGCIHPLIYAIEDEKIDAAEKLIELGSDINFTYHGCKAYRYNSPLYAAIKGGYWDLVDLLLSKGVKYDEILNYMSNPRYVMYSPGHREMLEQRILAVKYSNIKGISC